MRKFELKQCIMQKERSIFDVIIIGAGPIGLACALACKANGLKYTIIEKGCLVNYIYH